MAHIGATISRQRRKQGCNTLWNRTARRSLVAACAGLLLGACEAKNTPRDAGGGLVGGRGEAGSDAGAPSGGRGGAGHDAGTATAGSAASCLTDADCPGVGACPPCANSASCAELICMGGRCQFTCPDALHWFATCGDPVCSVEPDPFDRPDIRNCGAAERMGTTCGTEGERCDGVLGCGAMLVCADRDPTAGFGGCPISRARHKRDIHYLGSSELRAYHEEVLRMPLASWRYKGAANGAPQLGFVIEDVEPSAAVSGDRVNLYGYLSMAVAAIQVQERRIEALEVELEKVRNQLVAARRRQAQPTQAP